ncbi:LutB/LldF family L-lactate oxidation iron-sulfur protein [Usitatibacter palustris]|uniref:Lactate utilization protein B n=1 Tax=Usitatibacter palustris TaxID=2732487 RepID=A0A6M4H9F7_9PROT|nr:LutB/LldF family L-lactate oxidation iron-sulfur protein [Usitatibacter palustris]QJR16196.1 Lactate utilization protein B [Usitatibacter palustris]
MRVQSMFFKKNATEKLDDAVLQRNLRTAKGKFVDGRAKAVAEIDEWEAIRTHAAALRDRALADLDAYLVEFERNAIRRGTVVHWAQTAQEACAIAVEIARANGVRKVTKSKSMVSEEVNLNERLEEAGIEVIETDLGEYILQLAHEPPSHIVAPAVHKSKEQVAELFEAAHKKPRLTDIAQMTREAREALRDHFLTADMGISGSNFVIAETGTTLTVTNEGNADMVTTLPRIHCVITGIEKVIPTLEDFATLIRLLPRSAIGQTIGNYLTLTTGVKGPGDTDGPEQMHVILVDAGRSKFVGTEMQSMLRCIRCGACMNHCPVYQNVGGHAYGWVYPGPMGSVLTPVYVGIENAGDLPNAATFCGECAVVCPVKIPLPDLMRKLREQQFNERLRPWTERFAIRAWSYAARRPKLYALLTRFAAEFGARLGGREKLIHYWPGLDGWTRGRDIPAPEGRTFRELYRERLRAPWRVKP